LRTDQQQHARVTQARVVLCLLLVAFIGLARISAAADSAPIAGLNSGVVFSDYSPLSTVAELARRLLSPMNAERMFRQLPSAAAALHRQTIDLAQESFALYVPAHVPARGYALLVFVPPWQNAMLPLRWGDPLDRHDMIYVSAAHSGNGTDILNRREPLAVLAADNVMRHYPVDPQRVYIGGFSGGSRVALRVALAYPDVFHGALLIAGSDPIGDLQAPLPPEDLFRQFQSATRLVYLTGAHDAINLEQDAGSRQSLRQWCVFDTRAELLSRAGHDLPDPSSLDRALTTLTAPVAIDGVKLAECRARVAAELSANLEQVADVAANGKLRAARMLLQKIDAHYGGLAAPRSLELAREFQIGR
jgi:pimeloyl-ACP methyl ester carboxylesterase